jgi:hypothetical protein
MKRIALFAVLFVLVVGCSDNNELTYQSTTTTTENNGEITTNSLQQDLWGSTTSPEEDDDFIPVNPMIEYFGGIENVPPPKTAVDIDLAMIPDEDFSDKFAGIMYLQPDDYLGKTMRLIGEYNYRYIEDIDIWLHALVFEDEAGCCAYEVELGFSEDNKPEKFPEDNTLISIIGEYTSYFDESIQWDIRYILVEILEEIVL